jgi:hypothetical protein
MEPDRDVVSPVYSDWAILSVKVSHSDLREFCNNSESSPSGSPWSIPHLTIPIDECGMLSWASRLNEC